MFDLFVLRCQILSGQVFNHDDLDNKLLKFIFRLNAQSIPIH